MNRTSRIVLLAVLMIPACATGGRPREPTSGASVVTRRVQPPPVTEADAEVREARFGFEQARLRREEARARARAAEDARARAGVVGVDRPPPAKPTPPRQHHARQDEWPAPAPEVTP